MQILEIKSKIDFKTYITNYKKEKGQKSLHRAVQNSKRLKALIDVFCKEEDLTYSAKIELILSDTERPKCAVCRKKTSFNLNMMRFLECCSAKCAANNTRRNKQIQKTNLEKYGNENFWGSKLHQENLKAFAIEEYGADHYMKSEDFKEKSKQTSLLKYGTEKPSQSEEIRQKIRDTRNSLDKKAISEKAKITWIKKYGVDHPSKHPIIFEKQQKSSFYRKDFFLPSGRKVQLQGFEPMCLEELLKSYEEEEILCSTKEIFTLLGPIDYVDINGKTRRYFPDFYIPKENKIIEVKSSRTYSVHEMLNEAKRKECEVRGFLFEFWVYGSEGLKKF
jgi:hypothetical protein